MSRTMKRVQWVDNERDIRPHGKAKRVARVTDRRAAKREILAMVVAR